MFGGVDTKEKKNKKVGTSKLVWTDQNKIQARNEKTISRQQRSDVLERAFSDDVYISKANQEWWT